MTRYLIRRILQVIPVLFAISILVYFMIAVSPIDPMVMYDDSVDMSPEDQALLEYRLGVNQPLFLNFDGSSGVVEAGQVEIFNKPSESGGTEPLQVGFFEEGEDFAITDREKIDGTDWVKVIQVETKTFGWITVEGIDVAIDPFDSQYFNWLFQVLKGDFGMSSIEHRPALDMILERLPATMLLMICALIGQVIIAIPVGVISALKQYSLFDHFFTILAYAGRSIPIFWFGLILIIVFNTTLDWPSWAGDLAGSPLFPGGGMFDQRLARKLGYTPWWDYLYHLILPVAMLSIFGAANYMRYTRSSMLDVINQDYIRTARGKGLKERKVLTRHALRNAAIPIVTVIAMDLPNLFGGALFTEQIFSWPGMGKLFYHAAMRGDYAVIMGIVIINAGLIVFLNLITDIFYSILDPRITYS